MPKAALERLVPLYMQDVYDAAKEEGLGRGLIGVGIPGMFGVGTQTYSSNTKKREPREDIIGGRIK